MTKNTRGGKRASQDIHFRRSLLRFTIAFGVVLIAGLLTRFAVSKIPLEKQIMESIELPEQWHFTLNKPEIEFSSGWLPVIGVRVQSLELQEKACSTNKLLVQDGLVIVNPFSLLGGRLDPYQVDFELLEISRAKDCGAETKKEDPVEKQKPSSRGEKKPLVSSAIKSPDLWQNFFAEYFPKIKKFPLRKVNIKRFKFNLIESLESEIRLEGRVRMRVTDQLKIRADLKKFFYQQKQLEFLSNRLTATADEQSVSADWKASVREGAIGMKMEILNTEGFPAKADLQINKLPVSAWTSLFSNDFDINFLWLSCHTQLESLWKDIKSTDLEIKHCKMDGPYGSVVAHQIKGTLDKLGQARIEFNKLDLDKIVKNRRGLYLSGVLEKYGVLSGEIDMAADKVMGRGFLEKTELIFSNNQLRDIQRVNKVPFEVAGTWGRWEAHLRDVELDKGEFAGEIIVKGNENDSVAGRVAFHKLRFDPQIYKLMIQAEPTDLRLYGKFDYSDNKIQKWSALLATTELTAKNYKLKNLKVKGRNLAEGVSEVRFSAGSGEIGEKAVLLEWLDPTRLEYNFEEGKSVGFKELSTKLEIHRDRHVEWKRGYARLNSGWQLSSEGARSEERQVTAWLQWDRPDGKYLRWDFNGALFDGVWKPVTPWVQNWLQDNAEFLRKNKSIRRVEGG